MAKKAKELLENNKSTQEGGILPSSELNLVELEDVKSAIKKNEKLRKSKQKKIVLEDDGSLSEEQKGKFDEAEQSVAKQSSRKKKITNICFFILNIIILAAMLTWNILEEGFVPLGDLPLHGWAAIVLVLLFVGSLICEVLAISYLLKKSTGKWRWGLCFKVHTIGKYYDNITPLGTGGQPFQITYFKNHDVPMHTSLAVPLAKYVFSQIVWTVVSFICMIICFTSPNPPNGIVVVSVIGFVLGSLLLFVVAFLSISKSVGRKLVVKTLKLLQKMKIVKNYEKQYAKISKYIEDFQSVMKQYMTSFKDFVILFGLLLLRLVLTYSIPYFIVCLFTGPQDGIFINCFVLGIMVDLAAGCFPLPGGSGMNELSFKLMFDQFLVAVGGGAGTWALLLWRLLTYYAYLILGASVLTYDISFGNRKYKWQKRKEELEEESNIFKQEQINRFRNERNKRRRAQSQRF